MHEESLVRSLVGQIGRLVTEHGAHCAAAVCVEAGPLSGVEPELFRLAFARLAPSLLGVGCTLQFNAVPLLLYCPACGAESHSGELVFVCPQCGGRQVEIRGGDRVILESVTLVTESPPASVIDKGTLV